ncbi:C39 family peptidase [Apilactobacillus bombintestini]|uniref:Peptidase C39-like domain-containing protein n=1 Tax=Apilactobacillus bombintestini TaxID=2419772 RepID=A0A387AQC9_9LACO|nr:C39 family peptidase [Apilactobacillus bombintestini]AYF92203.1 hypothetical protein D7I45_01205 [Apilactobacillus bombintestini]
MKKMLSSLGLVMLFGATAVALGGQPANAETTNQDNQKTEQPAQQSSGQNNSQQGQTSNSANNQNSSNNNNQNNNSQNQQQQQSDNKSDQQNQQPTPQPQPKPAPAPAPKPAKHIAHASYRIRSARKYNARVIRSNNMRLFSKAYNPSAKYLGKPQLKGQLVQVIRVARSRKTKHSVKRTYYQISYRGQIRGWVNAIYLRKTRVYEIPFTYTSQHFPFNAPNGCEATALKMALSAKNVGLNQGVDEFLRVMPRSSYDYNEGFVGNPYAVNHTEQDWTIYPRALARFGRQFRKYVYNITGASKMKIIREVRHGNPVIAATGYRMRKATGHTLVVVGYKHGYFKMADPSSWRGTFKHANNLPVFWVSTRQFMRIYNHEGRKAVLVH